MGLKKCICGLEFTQYNTIQSKCPKCTLESCYKLKPKKIKPYIRKPIKKRKKSSLNALLDTLWSKAVKILGNNVCEHCGSCEGLNSHHVIGRRNFAVRWNVNNGSVLCPKCHVFSSKFSAHQTPTLFSDFIQEKRGSQWYSQLVMMSTMEKPDKEELLIELKTIVYGPRKELPF